LRRWVKWALALPAALVAMTLLGHAAVAVLVPSGASTGWFLPSLGTLLPWSPWHALGQAPLTLSAALGYVPELVAVALVALVSVVSKTATLEVARKTSGDLDVELRAHGAATLAVAPLGGILASMQLGSSRLLEFAGGSTRFSGVACSLVLVAVGVAQIDLPGLIPLPIAAALLFYLGFSFLLEGLGKSVSQRQWLQLALALAIATACVRYGYLAGVIGGVVAACLMFAISYARTGAVRQHLSRAQFSGHVSRAPETARFLAEHGESIQLYWLSGYLFFGSSEGVFERVRADLAARAPRQVSHVVLDFALVSGCDASATASLVKLQHHCIKHGVALVFSAIAAPLRRTFERDGLLRTNDPQRAFPDVACALAWCEERVLETAGQATGEGAAGLAGFEPWLQQQLGEDVRAADLLAYLERRDAADSQVLYRQGDPSDEIDLVVAGRLAVDIAASDGQPMRARTITTYAVVGEMGFFRRVMRSATVSSEGRATRFTLTRDRYECMRRERPDLALAFDVFLLRTLADRINVSERMAAALAR
jgi:SulP family sulfate permease